MGNNNNQQGFTLIEVLIAIVILAVGILGVATMQISSLNGNSNAIRITDSATWGGDALEGLMGEAYDSANLLDNNAVGVNAGVTGLNNTDVAGFLADSVLPPQPQGGYAIFCNVAEDYPVLGTKTIRIIVRRNDRGINRIVSQDFIRMEPI